MSSRTELPPALVRMTWVYASHHDSQYELTLLANHFCQLGELPLAAPSASAATLAYLLPGQKVVESCEAAKRASWSFFTLDAQTTPRNLRRFTLLIMDSHLSELRRLGSPRKSFKRLDLRTFPAIIGVLSRKSLEHLTQLELKTLNTAGVVGVVDIVNLDLEDGQLNFLGTSELLMQHKKHYITVGFVGIKQDVIEFAGKS